ncbi:MAG: hypothetical protein KJ630_23965 [Proteobacteria bacterium]|nr:hypothetical protein [Pseudomonadota bacterium]
MKIAATAVGMDAARTYRDVDQRMSGLSPKTGTDTAVSADDFSIRLSSSLSSSSLTQFTSQSVVCRLGGGGCAPLAQNENGPAKEAEKALSQLAEQVIGQPVTISEVQENLLPPTPLVSPLVSRNAALPVQMAELISSHVYRQEEKVMFSAEGQVQTVDGRKISFNLGLSMERTTVVAESITTGLTMFIDPLVLQFDTTTPLLSDSLFFSFDLDSDGQKEQLACPGKGCGFLAFDRNNDGVINNGLELFGPATGKGFGELVGYDTDANQWIDENDPIYDKLSILRFDGNGGASLQSLRQAGVGAISVVHAGTNFQLQNLNGRILGTVKASGIFLTEDGEIRPLQEVDFAMPSIAVKINSGGWPPVSDQPNAAMQVLRDIIGMQQFRLTMRLAEQRLQNARQKVEQRQRLLSWLQNRSEWQAMTSDRSEDIEKTLYIECMAASPHFWSLPDIIGKKV